MSLTDETSGANPKRGEPEAVAEEPLPPDEVENPVARPDSFWFADQGVPFARRHMGERAWLSFPMNVPEEIV